MALPGDIRRRFGYALSLAQMGDQDDSAKVLKGFATPREDMDTVRARLKVAETLAQELRLAKANH
jgi:phage-related protein